VKTLFTEQQVRQGIEQLAQRLNTDFGTEPLTVIAVMTGSIIFMADLIRLLQMPLRVGVVQASSYQGSMQRSQLSINANMMPDIQHHRVLLIDDIFDTGHTLVEVTRLMQELNPISLHTAVLLRKADCQQVSYEPNYVVFEIPNAFVVGYGLDYEDRYRNLNYVAVLDSTDLATTFGSP
jgi:hypoxanthine phosphoribosyltransferase